MIRIGKIESVHPHKRQEKSNSQAEENPRKNNEEMHGGKFTEILLMTLEKLEKKPTQA